LFCVVDADSLLEVESLLSSVRPFMEEPGRMIAVGGTIRVLNGCTVRAGQITNMGLPHNPLALIQYIEYIRAFLMARLAWSRWGMLSIISGAFGIFRRDVVLEVGGFSHGTVGEDYELVIKLHKLMRDQGRPYSMRYVPEPVCWTEAPETFKVLATQRKRWQRGALEVFFKHRDMLLRPKYGMLGMVGLPNNLVIDVLGPLAELAGYVLMPILWMAGRLNGDFILAYTALFFFIGGVHQHLLADPRRDGVEAAGVLAGLVEAVAGGGGGELWLPTVQQLVAVHGLVGVCRQKAGLG